VSSGWAQRVVERGVANVARALGLAVSPPRNGTGGALYCPACNAERRHTKSGDKRLAADVTPNGRGWHCYQCEAKGDALDVVAYRMRGVRFRELGDAARDEVRAWCAREWSDVAELLDAAARRAPAPALPPLPAPTATPDAPLEYPTADALALWDACVPVKDDAEVLRYLAAPRAEGGRGIVNAASLPPHIARALPPDARPAWTTHRPDPAAPAATWAETGHRLVLPTYDAGGVHRSVLARAIVPTSRKSTVKGRRSGLVLANGRACGVLRGNPLKLTSDGERRIIIAEGEIDWLTWVARGGETVLGIMAGSWTPELAARLPDGALLVVRTDADDAGVQYAQNILDSVRDRVKCGALVARFAPHFAVVDGRRVTLKQEAAG
jgi:hypothetical protein